jgi:hypothetical protein
MVSPKKVNIIFYFCTVFGTLPSSYALDFDTQFRKTYIILCNCYYW